MSIDALKNNLNEAINDLVTLLETCGQLKINKESPGVFVKNDMHDDLGIKAAQHLFNAFVIFNNILRNMQDFPRGKTLLLKHGKKLKNIQESFYKFRHISPWDCDYRSRYDAGEIYMKFMVQVQKMKEDIPFALDVDKYINKEKPYIDAGASGAQQQMVGTIIDLFSKAMQTVSEYKSALENCEAHLCSNTVMTPDEIDNYRRLLDNKQIDEINSQRENLRKNANVFSDKTYAVTMPGINFSNKLDGVMGGLQAKGLNLNAPRVIIEYCNAQLCVATAPEKIDAMHQKCRMLNESLHEHEEAVRQLCNLCEKIENIHQETNLNDTSAIHQALDKLRSLCAEHSNKAQLGTTFALYIGEFVKKCRQMIEDLEQKYAVLDDEQAALYSQPVVAEQVSHRLSFDASGYEMYAEIKPYLEKISATKKNIQLLRERQKIQQKSYRELQNRKEQAGRECEKISQRIILIEKTITVNKDELAHINRNAELITQKIIFYTRCLQLLGDDLHNEPDDDEVVNFEGSNHVPLSGLSNPGLLLSEMSDDEDSLSDTLYPLMSPEQSPVATPANSTHFMPLSSSSSCSSKRPRTPTFQSDSFSFSSVPSAQISTSAPSTPKLTQHSPGMMRRISHRASSNSNTPAKEPTSAHELAKHLIKDTEKYRGSKWRSFCNETMSPQQLCQLKVYLKDKDYRQAALIIRCEWIRALSEVTHRDVLENEARKSGVELEHLREKYDKEKRHVEVLDTALQTVSENLEGTKNQINLEKNLRDCNIELTKQKSNQIQKEQQEKERSERECQKREEGDYHRQGGEQAPLQVGVLEDPDPENIALKEAVAQLVQHRRTLTSLCCCFYVSQRKRQKIQGIKEIETASHNGTLDGQKLEEISSKFPLMWAKFKDEWRWRNTKNREVFSISDARKESNGSRTGKLLNNVRKIIFH